MTPGFDSAFKGVPETVPLPSQGRPERVHLYRWTAIEEAYVAGKFDALRGAHDASLLQTGVDGRWKHGVMQYLDRAQLFLDEARLARQEQDLESARHLEQRAQQAIAKCFMTAKALAESSIRVFGGLPAPGYSSGNVEPWDEIW